MLLALTEREKKSPLAVDPIRKCDGDGSIFLWTVMDRDMHARTRLRTQWQYSSSRAGGGLDRSMFCALHARDSRRPVWPGASDEDTEGLRLCDRCTPSTATTTTPARCKCANSPLTYKRDDTENYQCL